MESPQFNEEENHEFQSGSHPENGNDVHLEEAVGTGKPHDALFLVLAYLGLLELLSMMGVCRSLRDAVNNDVLLWLDVVVVPPLSCCLSNDALLNITSKAHGRLRTLFLNNCVKITDDGLQRVIEKNPHINKLYVPACTSLTANGIVTIVQLLTGKNQDLKHLRLYGMLGITKQHMETILSCLNVQKEEDHEQPISFLYHRRSSLSSLNATHPIDVNVCPKCNCVNLVYDCPRESCKWKREYPLLECRGCYHCISRCDECGGCVNLDELGITACQGFLCSDCWLRLPKCYLCNRRYRKLHADRPVFPSDDTGSMCPSCHISSSRHREWLLEFEEHVIRDYCTIDE